MGLTPIHKLPWPEPTDAADGPAGFQGLALATEAALGAPVSALPGTPYDGQVIRYKVAAAGPVWTLLYLAASPAPYRWHFVGGAPLADQIDAQEAPPQADWPGVDCPTVGPTITPPLAGEYLVTAAFSGAQNASGQQWMSYTIGATAAAWYWATGFQAGSGVNYWQSHERTHRHTIATAGAMLRAKYMSLGGGAQYRQRTIIATPVRVG